MNTVSLDENLSCAYGIMRELFAEYGPIKAQRLVEMTTLEMTRRHPNTLSNANRWARSAFWYMLEKGEIDYTRHGMSDWIMCLQ